MSTYPPRLEARVSAQERMQTILHARMEELAQDMSESFKQQAAYQVHFEQKVDARFDSIESKLTTLEATMATKEDLADLQSHLESRLTTVEKLLLQVLARLPEQS